MILAFSGTSGSGKSTIIQELRKSDILKEKNVVIRSEDSFMTIRLLKHILGENLFSQYKDEKFFKKQYHTIFYSFFKNLSYIFYPLVVYMEFLIDYIWYEVLFKDKVLIVDKFIFDHSVQFTHILGINNIIVKWFFHHYPKPYLTFLIDINLENAAYSRNKNNIPGKITAQRAFHKRMLASYHAIAKKHNLLVIDNNGNLQDTVKEILYHIKNKEVLLNAKKIAICGIDGTGKTTVITMLAAYASKLNISSKIIHFVHNNLLYRTLVSLGYYELDRPKADIYKMSRAHSARERIKKTSFLKAFLRFFDSYVQYVYYLVTNRSRLLLFDRYFYDYSASFAYLQIWRRSFFNHLIPSMRNKFLFVVSPQISYRRKPERVKAFFVECHEIYLKVAKEQNITVIKTDNKTPSEILQELLKSIQ